MTILRTAGAPVFRGPTHRLIPASPFHVGGMPRSDE
jgi:hypothetical protein